MSIKKDSQIGERQMNPKAAVHKGFLYDEYTVDTNCKRALESDSIATDFSNVTCKVCLRSRPRSGAKRGSVDKIERGRIWNHRNGQLEQDIFDRDLRIKELTAENAWLKKERIDQDKWWTQEMKDVNAENAKLKAQLAVSESIRNHSLRAENVKLENEKACHTMDLASRDTEIGMLKHSIAKCRRALEYIELTGGNCGHEGQRKCVPCPCGGCMANEAAKTLEETK